MWYDAGDTIEIALELNRNLFEEHELLCPFVVVLTSYDSNCDRVVYARARFYNVVTHEISRRIPHFFNPERSILVTRASAIAEESTSDAVMSAMMSLDASLDIS